MLWLLLWVSASTWAGDLPRSLRPPYGNCNLIYRALAKPRISPALQGQLEEAVLEEVHGSLMGTRVPAAQRDAWNKLVLDALDRAPLPKPAPGRLASFNEDQMRALWEKIHSHPVAALCHIREKYDPARRGLGFCYGRAMAAHLEALRMGLDKESIRKLWMVHSPEVQAGDGRIFHVTTIVRGTDGNWHAIDPVVSAGRPMRARDWFASWESSSGDQLQAFTTHARRFTPYASFAYRPQDIFDPFYNEYFTDLMRVSREEARQMIDQGRGSAEGLPPLRADQQELMRQLRLRYGLSP